MLGRQVIHLAKAIGMQKDEWISVRTIMRHLSSLTIISNIFYRVKILLVRTLLLRGTCVLGTVVIMHHILILAP